MKLSEWFLFVKWLFQILELVCVPCEQHQHYENDNQCCSENNGILEMDLLFVFVFVVKWGKWNQTNQSKHYNVDQNMGRKLEMFVQPLSLLVDVFVWVDGRVGRWRHWFISQKWLWMYFGMQFAFYKNYQSDNRWEN